MSIAEKALEAHLAADDVAGHEEGAAEQVSPSREVLREAWSAVERKDFDGFADAVEALVEIKLSEGR